MSKFDKISVLNKIGSTGMVPVFYHKDAEVAKKDVYKRQMLTRAAMLNSAPRLPLTWRVSREMMKSMPPL